MVPLFLWMFWRHYPQDDGRSVAFFVYITACATDFLDGQLARKWNVISDFGRLIDPLADKLMTISVLGSFLIEGSISPIYVAIILTKDLVLVIGGTFLARRKIIVFSFLAGKIATALIMLGMCMTFFPTLEPANQYVLWLGLGFSMAAFISYVRYGWTQYKKYREAMADTVDSKERIQ